MAAERVESQQVLTPTETERSELQKMAGESVLLYTKDVLPGLQDSVSQWKGRIVVGEVEGRPDDDEIEIDKYGEEVFKKIIHKNRYPIRAQSEHSYFGMRRDFKIQAAGDPFDNSSQYKRKLPTPVFSCLSEYDMNGNPLSGAVIDIRPGKVTAALADKVYVFDNFPAGSTPRRVHKSERTTIKDPEITIASYTGSKEYAVKFYSDFDEGKRRFNINFGKMINDMHEKGRTYADGGAFIYGLLAEGVVDAYVMKDEPVSEIAAGAAVAMTAGCTLWCVDEKGNIENYRFDPKKFRENVPLFIASGTPELAQEIYDYYFKYKGSEGDVRIPFYFLGGRLD